MGTLTWGQGKIRKPFGAEPTMAETQLELVKKLLKIRVPPISYKMDSSFNKTLNKLEKLMEEKGLELRFVREDGESDFAKPLEGVKFNHEGSTPGGTCADVLEMLCHEAGCAYCIREGQIHIFKAETNPIEIKLIYPERFIEQYYSLRGGKLEQKHTPKASRKIGKAKVSYDRKHYALTISDNPRNLFLIRQSLNRRYTEWLRTKEAAQERAESTRTKRFKLESQLIKRQVVPVEFDAGCSLEVLMRYLELHMSTGRIQTPMRVSSRTSKTELIDIKDSINFNYCTVLEALDKVCDALNGHYTIDGRRLIIVPREIETRQYYAYNRTVRAFACGDFINDWAWEAMRKKSPKKLTITDEKVQTVLETAGIEFPATGGASYDTETRILTISTTQAAFRNVNRQLMHLYNKEHK